MSFILWLSSFAFTNIITHYRNKYIEIKDKIQDISTFDFSKHKWVTDIFPLLSILCISKYTKYIACHAILLFLRFICFNITILPPPMKLQTIRWSLGIIPNFQYDLVFSGHTMTSVLAIYCVNTSLWRVIAMLLSVCTSISVIITKEHYTLDVIVAWIATQAVVSLYTVEFRTFLE